MKLFRVQFYTRVFFPNNQIKVIELYANDKQDAEARASKLNRGGIIFLTTEI